MPASECPCLITGHTEGNRAGKADDRDHDIDRSKIVAHGTLSFAPSHDRLQQFCDVLSPSGPAWVVEQQGQREAAQTEVRVLERLRALPDGKQKAAETKPMIDRLRTFVGYREYAKYSWVCRYFVYRQALLTEAPRLVEAGVLSDQEDISLLTFGELCHAVRTSRVSLVFRSQEAPSKDVHASSSTSRTPS